MTARETWQRPPEMEIDPTKRYRSVIETSKGTIVADLFAAEAPRTANNFVFLARQGFYDGLTFHRVIPEFVVQGGDPRGTGEGASTPASTSSWRARSRYATRQCPSSRSTRP